MAKKLGSIDSGTPEDQREQHERLHRLQAETAPGHQGGEIEQSVAEPEPQYQNLAAQIDMDAWRQAAKGKQLRVLISGLGGVGKSTLINQLLRLKQEGERAKEGRGGATTFVVSKHERTTEKGMKVCLFDAPGFGDLDIEDEDIIAMMEKETEKRLDVVFYCISLSGPCRVQREDAKAAKTMTRAFGANIWRKAVIVLTFANVLEANVKNKAEYETTITRIQEAVRQALRKDPLISEEIIAQLPIVTAGHAKQILKYEAEECKSLEGWGNRLFLKALEQIDPDIVPTLFEARYNWKDLGVGSIIGAGVGIVIGAVVGGSLYISYSHFKALIQILWRKYSALVMSRDDVDST